MIKIKTLEEIEKIKKACSILAEVKKIVYDFISPGVSLKEIDSVAFKEIIKRQGKPAFLGQYGFPNTCCISVNEELIHGIPSDYVVKNGDIVKIDMGVIWDGYYSDSAFTKGVGDISEQDKKLIQVAKDAFYAGFNAIKVGKRIGDISFAIGSYIKSQGFYTPEEYTGHGIGKELHEDPIVDNDGVPRTGPIIRNGMVICIEPMILQKSKNVVVKKDRWTVVDPYGLNTSHYEQTVLIYDNKAYILTGDNI
ncbi:type I methionyl aminopeptidase [Metamycoplasma hyosynoviae]|uniref:type I methionyl aminopeptidase n=1 Tax=Metamycoplasma hyosynoviae TaxID=29559 RepID=UPI002359A4CA|nr:type I methionyl aminopeptidase [Metamycoplasma hyosynoviae]MDC8918557.1 type I methionyl aminopeptidase [Metamycoplasma hyosynoviae]MDD1373834.1 type I methionyl aminopeptidase [Metamycoplasma hyosynoviae]MDD1375486.1 type I methionyl aminopeptidase [Metamycoplasma hyosynoviae]MDD1376054.1 type I methionyl aminopeptidase [Metamycoplasma hyosynoviae]MDD1377241.1 type I methionyl aminopeptidase [Metamycoplasma hyosynoviae]